MKDEWNGFHEGHWTKEIDVRDFIQNNYTPYEGDASFLKGPTKATTELWNKVQALQKEMAGAGEDAGLSSDEDVMAAVKELRSKEMR